MTPQSTAAVRPRLFRSARLSRGAELELAVMIREAEALALALIAEHPAARAVLEADVQYVGSTRVGELLRLEAAVTAAAEATPSAPGAMGAADALERAETLRWRLAMSGRHIALAEARKLSGALMDEEDLFQEGLIGLVKAARRFEPQRGLRFSTYAHWWVRAQITRTIDRRGRLVHISTAALDQARTLRKFRDELEVSGEPISYATLSKYTGLRIERIHELLKPVHTLSLETPIDRAASRTLGDTLVDDQSALQDARFGDERALHRLRLAFVSALSDRERIVLIRRFGLDDSPPGTLTAIGDELGLSRERVRQLELGALRRLGRALQRYEYSA